MENEKKLNPLLRYLPILGWLPKYQGSWLRTDLIAGLTIVALLVPEGRRTPRSQACRPRLPSMPPDRAAGICRIRHLAGAGGGSVIHHCHDVFCHGQPDR